MNSNEIKKILSDYIDIIENYESSVSKKEGYSFNTFNISTYGTQLENFHSDIISELLNPNGSHKESTLPAYEFLRFLNKFYKVNIDVDRKSTRLNSSHVRISYAVFCLKKKNKDTIIIMTSNLWSDQIRKHF